MISLYELFILQQLPNFVRDCLQRALMPLDGGSLVESLHSRGINIRYVGKLAKVVQNVKQLTYLKVSSWCTREPFLDHIHLHTLD